MTLSINEMDRRLRRLEGIFERALSAVPNPLPSAVPEVAFAGVDGSIGGETAQVIGLPGVTSFVPPGCNLLVARVKHGQDPVVIAGTGTPVAIKAVQVLAATYAAAAGGVIIADPVAGTSAIVVTPLGIHVIGPAGMINAPAITAAFTTYTGTMNTALGVLATAIGALSDPPSADGIAGAVTDFALTMTAATTTLLSALVAP